MPAVRLAFSRSPAPSVRASSAFAPTPVPMATATISSCTGNASPSAVSASSPPSRIRDKYALSTMLYTACSIIEQTIGTPTDSISRPTGAVPSWFSVCFSVCMVKIPLFH